MKEASASYDAGSRQSRPQRHKAAAASKASKTYNVKKPLKGKGILSKIKRGVSSAFKRHGKKAKQIIKTVVKEGSKILRDALNTNPLSRPGFTGEMHAIELQGPYKGSSYNYAGPGTNIKARLARGDPPINKIDEYAMNHDIAYSKIKPDDADISQKVRAADEAFLKGLAPYISSHKEAAIAVAAVGGKLAAQITGKVPWNKFISSGGKV